MIQQHDFSNRFLRDVLCDHPINAVLSHGPNSKAKFQADSNLRKAKDFYLDHIEDYPLVMFDKEIGICSRKSKRTAVAKYAWIEYNRTTKIRNLVIDIDNDRWREKLDKGLLPMPNLIIINPLNGHAHLVYFLKYTVDREKAKQYSHFKDVRDAINAVAEGDLKFYSRVAKNPYHRMWNTEAPVTYSIKFTLSDFYDFVKVVPKKQSRYFSKNVELIAFDEIEEGNRNIGIFDHLRCWAYCHIHLFKEAAYSAWVNECTKVGESMNNTIDRPLSDKEISRIIKSISTWVARKYTGKGLGQKEVNRGRDEEEVKELETKKQKQSVSGKITGRNKCIKTMNEIVSGIESLIEKGIRPTKANLVKHEKLTAGRVYNKTYSVLFDTTDFDAAMKQILDGEHAKKVAEKEAALQAKISSNTNKIKEAIVALVASSKRVSKRSVAIEAGITERVIYSPTYNHLFNTGLLNINNNKLRLGASKEYSNNSKADVEDEARGFNLESIKKLEVYSNVFEVEFKCWGANDENLSGLPDQDHREKSKINVFTFDLKLDQHGNYITEITQYKKTGS